MGDEIKPAIYGVTILGRDVLAKEYGLSFEGGAELLFSGSQFSHYPADNVVKMKSSNP